MFDRVLSTPLNCQLGLLFMVYILLFILLRSIVTGLFVDDPDFEGISKHEDFFNYATGPLLNGLYWEQYYDGADVKNKEHHFIYFENKLIGVPRIRQVRIKRNTCTYEGFCLILDLDMMQFVNVECYGNFFCHNVFFHNVFSEH